ncbi:hypothetical protein Tco_1121651 [Tanacetum coccineum]|uniref:Uncharacterized protein n=1 Tax=Tanacetum coccineum TaxID=301880 RepID=A0ABQ5IYP2_9ASTR
MITIGENLLQKGRMELSTQKQFGRIFLEARGYERSTTIYSGTSAIYRRRMSPDKAKEKRLSSRQKQNHPRRSNQACRSTNHERGTLPQLALKPDYDKEA